MYFYDFGVVGIVRMVVLRRLWLWPLHWCIHAFKKSYHYNSSVSLNFFVVITVPYPQKSLPAKNTDHNNSGSTCFFCCDPGERKNQTTNNALRTFDSRHTPARSIERSTRLFESAAAFCTFFISFSKIITKVNDFVFVFSVHLQAQRLKMSILIGVLVVGSSPATYLKFIFLYF